MRQVGTLAGSKWEVIFGGWVPLKGGRQGCMEYIGYMSGFRDLGFGRVGFREWGMILESQPENIRPHSHFSRYCLNFSSERIHVGTSYIPRAQKGSHIVTLGLYEPLSKLLVSPLITPIVVPYITPFEEFRL